MTDYVLLDVLLLALLTITAVAAVAMRNLFASTVILSIYSFLMACVWSNMDSQDVALTEAAVGAGVSTILLLGTILLVGSREKPERAVHWPALLAVTAVGAALLYGTADMPRFGDPQSPANSSRVSKGYILQDVPKVADAAGHHTGPRSEGNYFHDHVPNMVTAVIVSYRAYDTMFETVVIFIAGLGLILFLRRRTS